MYIQCLAWCLVQSHGFINAAAAVLVISIIELKELKGWGRAGGAGVGQGQAGCPHHADSWVGC